MYVEILLQAGTHQIDGLLLETKQTLSCLEQKSFIEKDVISVNDTSDWEETNPSTCPPNRRRTYDLLVTSPDALSPSYRRLVGAKATLLLLEYEKSLFLLGPSSKTRETRK